VEARPHWFYAAGKKKLGPVSLVQLRQMAASGQLKATDMVMEERSGKWQPAHTVAGLFPSEQSAPSNPPAVSPAPASANGMAPAALPGPAARWFFARNKAKQGPVSWEILQRMTISGELKPGDMVLPPGATKWLPGGAIEGLFPPAGPAPAAPPTSPAFPGPKPPVLAPPSPPIKKLPPEETPTLALPSSVVAEDALAKASPFENSYDSFFSGTEELALADLPPPKPRPKLPPASLRACPHCQGTAFCGRKWDPAGIMESGTACSTCRHASGHAPDEVTAKVTCSVCQGKGFVPEAPEDPRWQPEAVAWRLRGLAHSDSGEYGRAVKAFTEALRIEPDYADVYYDRGWALIATGRNDEGEADLVEAAELSEKFATQDPATPPPQRGWFGWLFRKQS